MAIAEERKSARDLVVDWAIEALTEEGGPAEGATVTSRLSRYTDIDTGEWEITVERDLRPFVINVRVFNKDDVNTKLAEFELLGVSANTIVALVAAVVGGTS